MKVEVAWSDRPPSAKFFEEDALPPTRCWGDTPTRTPSTMSFVVCERFSGTVLGLCPDHTSQIAITTRKVAA